MVREDLRIIQSPEAERMRGMVTEGFYDRSRIGLWMFEVIGREYDDMAEWARSLRLEAFPQTCTWSIAIWEFVYGYVPDDRLTLEYRRQRILSHKISRHPINPARIEAILSALTACPVTVTEHVKPYTFRVVVNESNKTVDDHTAALRTLREIKPSHLSFTYESLIVAEYTVYDYNGAAACDFLREYYSEDIYIETDTMDWYAATGVDMVREYVVGDERVITTDVTDYNAGIENVLISDYIIEERPIQDTAVDYYGGAVNEIIREAHDD